MKTIREWLEELPEPYRTQALTNAWENRLGYVVETMYEALDEAFTWSASPEGFGYWAEVSRSLRPPIEPSAPTITSITSTATRLFALGSDGRVYQTANRDDPAEAFWTALPPLP